MKKILVLTLGLLFFVASYAQVYTYSFSGSISPEMISVYEADCSNFKRVSSVKIKYKPDSERGEFIIEVDPEMTSERAEGKVSFQPTDIKKYMISKGLNPLEFRKIK